MAISLAILYGIRQNNLSQDGSPISSDLVASKCLIRIHRTTTHLSSLRIKTMASQSGRGEARTDVKTEREVKKK